MDGSQERTRKTFKMKQLDLFSNVTKDSSFNDIVDFLGIVRIEAGNSTKWCFNGKCINRPKPNAIKKTLEYEFGIFTDLLKYRYDK